MAPVLVVVFSCFVGALLTDLALPVLNFVDILHFKSQLYFLIIDVLIARIRGNSVSITPHYGFVLCSVREPLRRCNDLFWLSFGFGCSFELVVGEGGIRKVLDFNYLLLHKKYLVILECRGVGFLVIVGWVVVRCQLVLFRQL